MEYNLKIIQFIEVENDNVLTKKKNSPILAYSNLLLL